METVQEIDGVIKERSHGYLGCSYDKYKGRITVARKPCEPGSELLRESNLAFTSEPTENVVYNLMQVWSDEDGWNLPRLWTWCVLCMLLDEVESQELTEICDVLAEKKELNKSFLEAGLNLLRIPLPRFPQQTKKRLCMLYSPEENPLIDTVSCNKRIREYIKWGDLIPQNAEQTRLIEFLNRIFDIRLWQKYSAIWVLNCFEGEQSPLTYLTYFAPAFASHSCLPNTLWHIDQNDIFCLIARCQIKSGEEIGFTYTSDSHLLEPTFSRRQDLLATKYFTCQCQRCCFPVDLSRGFICPHCRKGQFFFSSDHPVENSSEIEFQISKIDYHVEGKIISNFIKRVFTPSIYQLNLDTDARINGSLVEYITSLKPYVCLHCKAHMTKNDLATAESVENALLALGYKEDGEENILLSHVDTALIPSIVEHVSQAHLLLALFDKRQLELATTQPRLASEYAYARHILATQMCPVFTGYSAWTGNEVWELRLRELGFAVHECCELTEKEGVKLFSDLVAWQLVAYALRVVHTIFATGDHFWELQNVLNNVMKAVSPTTKIPNEIESLFSKLQDRVPYFKWSTNR